MAGMILYLLLPVAAVGMAITLIYAVVGSIMREMRVIVSMGDVRDE